MHECERPEAGHGADGSPRARMARRLGVLCAAVLGAWLLTPAAPASAAPNFQLPFPCGQTWSGQTRTNHSPANAIDFNRTDDSGDPVVASAAGTVDVVADLGGTSYGKYVRINHGSGWTTYHAHLSAFAVSEGDKVVAGTRIGSVGTTGGSTGPHLHYEQRLNGSAVKITFNGAQALYWGTKNYTSANECGANPYSPYMVCGNAYSIIDSDLLGTSGSSYGRVYLMYNSDNGYNCVATIKHKSVGTNSATSSYLEPEGGTRTTDSGSYGWYAGPVRKSAPSVCVKWGGAVNGVAYNSPFEHCS